ncbi:hypothetical protein PV05_00783 [Exophiala xenobiotica]|uniref:Uncharacterized protein n=1 Tax=Exophiala xenobiotica TaxID=348802 RepID=A0A0D2C6S3_9EURO|nr:uncharacterized protein PV05_00783 [Exophiala xenobiotica]KIW60576.1 hypothetical protein PV05_00783 [Exophiala xenobiotica]
MDSPDCPFGLRLATSTTDHRSLATRAITGVNQPRENTNQGHLDSPSNTRGVGARWEHGEVGEVLPGGSSEFVLFVSSSFDSLPTRGGISLPEELMSIGAGRCRVKAVQLFMSTRRTRYLWEMHWRRQQ